MAWNRADTSSQSAARKASGKSPSLVKGAIAGLAVVAVLGLAAFFIFGGKDAKPKAEKVEKKPAKIAEVKPSAAPTAKRDGTAIHDPTNTLPPQKVGEIRNGYIKFGNGKLHKVNGVVTNSLAHRRAKSSIFKHRSENIIAGLLALKPGDSLVGTPNYNGTFTKDFFDSLQDPIVVEPDDSDEHKELKRLVVDAKKSLKEAMDRGEDVEKIIMDARRECQELARYKQVLQKDVYEYAMKEEVTDDDVDLFVQAANKMLENKGIAPMKVGPITRLKLKMKTGGKK